MYVEQSAGQGMIAGPAINKAQSAQREIATLHDELSSRIESLSQSIAVLGDRLEIAMCPPVPANTSQATEKPMAPGSAIGARIERMVLQVKSMQCAINDISTRVQI